MGGVRLTYTIVTHAPAVESRAGSGRGLRSLGGRLGRAAPHRAARIHLYLSPPVALAAATIIGAWQTGGGAPPRDGARERPPGAVAAG